MKVILFFAILACASCYNPNYVGAGFVCRIDSDCPDRLTCNASTCGGPGAAGDLSFSDPDMKGDTGPDLLPARDLSRPSDLTLADAASPAVCPGAGVMVRGDGKVWACDAMFNMKVADFPCGGGSHVCGSGDEGELTGLNCPGGDTFYASKFFGKKADMCMDGGSFLLGCGGSSMLVTVATCHNLKQAIQCDSPPTNWTCGGMDASHSKPDHGGVLCCL